MRPRPIVKLELPDPGAADVPGARLARRAVHASLTLAALLGVAALATGVLVSVDDTVAASGTIEPLVVRPVRVREAGVVRAVLVAAGDTVRPGQPVVLLDSLELAATLADLLARRASVSLAARRSAQERRLEERVQDDRVVQARARLMAARADLLGRTPDFAPGAGIDSLLGSHRPGGNATLDHHVASVREAEADVRLAEAQRAQVELRRFDGAKASIDSAELEAQIRTTRERLSRLVVPATVRGTVLTEDLDRLTGTSVRAGDIVLEVGDLTRWRVVLYLRAAEVHRVRLRDTVRVRVRAFPAAEDVPLRGSVAFIAPEGTWEAATPPGLDGAGAEVGGRTGPLFRVVVELDQRQLAEVGTSKLKPHYGVQARIVARRERIVTLLWNYLRRGSTGLD